MNPDVALLTADMKLGAGVSAAEVEHAESMVGARLPVVYREFLVETGGGEGGIGPASWARFFTPADIEWYHRHYRSEDKPFAQFEGLILLGSDGGGTAFCFDAAGDVVEADFIAAPEDNRLRGTFLEFLSYLANDTGEDPIAGVGDPRSELTTVRSRKHSGDPQSSSKTERRRRCRCRMVLPPSQRTRTQLFRTERAPERDPVRIRLRATLSGPKR